MSRAAPSPRAAVRKLINSPFVTQHIPLESDYIMLLFMAFSIRSALGLDPDVRERGPGAGLVLTGDARVLKLRLGEGLLPVNGRVEVAAVPPMYSSSYVDGVSVALATPLEAPGGMISLKIGPGLVNCEGSVALAIHDDDRVLEFKEGHIQLRQDIIDKNTNFDVHVEVENLEPRQRTEIWQLLKNSWDNCKQA